MAFTSVAAPLIPETTVSTELMTDTEAETRTQNSNIASSSNAVKNDEDILTDKVLFSEEEYPEFATEEFWDWYKNASYEEKEDWFLVVSSETASSSNAKVSYPKFDLTSDEFFAWYLEHCMLETDEDSTEITLDYDQIYEYVQNMDLESAIGLVDFVYNSLNVRIMKFSAIGNMWPETYGASADFTSHGNGTEENPYIIDSVADLRGLAVYVANGQDSSDTYYRIESGTYDLNGCWIPIGFPLNDGGNYTAFKGHLTAEAGAEIINFGIGTNSTLGVDGTVVNRIKAQENVGFFGYLGADSSVEFLEVETDGNTIEGTTNVGILAGKATDASIKNCTVRGYVKGNRNVGGIVGYIESSASAASVRDSIIEDCNAEDVAVYSIVSDGGKGGVGGIAGYAKNTVIADVFVSTNTGSGRHIYGNSNTYTGGIVGIQKNSDIYNSYMKKGEIGDSAAYANGGIVGGYDGGEIKVARFSGTVNRPSSTNNYSACFIGTRINNAGFTYGENGNIAYLFADSETKANTGICGSKILDDNNYGLDAKIGYWHSSDRKYTLVTGANTSPSDNYFYQELEKGILTIMKNGNDADIIINHFTADNQGNPVRGYLLTIDEPRVNGTIAAKITAQIQGSYKPVVTAENLGAYQADDRVYVSFVNQSNGNVQFRLDPDKTPNPYYTYQEFGEFGYVNDEEDGLYTDGGYWLTMPESDTVISAHYKAAAKSVTLNPSKVTLEVTQERSGNRDNATVKWFATAKDDNGSIITDGNGNVWNKLELKTDNSNPEFYIDSLINGQTNDTFNLVWSTDNTNSSKVINNTVSLNGNAADKKSKFSINVSDSAMVNKTNELRAEQSANGNRDSITTNSPYRYHALITGIAQSGDGIDANDPPKGYLDIDIKFNIVDNTNVSVDGVSLSKNIVTYNIVRTLSGDRANPNVEYTVNGEAAGSDNTISALTATFNPDYFDNNKVKWYLSTPGVNDVFSDIQHVAVENDEDTVDDGTINVAVSGTGSKAYYNASVTLKGITSTDCTNATLAPIVNDQNATYTRELKAVPSTVTTYEKYVKVSAHDTNTNTVTDTCKVVVNFHTEDKTEIMPTSVKINNASNIGSYKIYYTFESNKDSTVTSRVITRENDASVTPLVNGVGQQLTATVSPTKDSARPEYQPYEDTVTWSLANPNAGSGSNLNVNDVLAIDPTTGQITIRGFNGSTDQIDLGYSPWIQSLISANKLDGTTVPVRIVATSDRDGSLVDYKDINVTFVGSAIDSTVASGLTFDAVLTKNVGTSLSDTGITEFETWSGTDGKAIDATITGTDEIPQFVIYDEDGVNVSTGIASIGDSMARSVAANKYVNINKEADWIKAVINSRASGNKDTQKLIVKAKTANGTSVKEIPVTVNFRYDGVDLSANTISEMPSGYTASPEVISSNTPNETYDVSKASVKDRTVLLDVISTQGNYSINNPETRKWSFGIVDLNDTTYTKDGVKTNDATYELSGDIAKYAKVDSHGYLVPTKGYWEDVISAGNVKGSVSGVVTAKKDVDGKLMTDSYKVIINFRYDKAVLESHEETFDLSCVQKTLTNGSQETWSGNEKVKLIAHIYDESGKDVTPVWESSDPRIVTVDADGNVTVNKNTWMREVIESAKVYGNKTHTGTKEVVITAKHPVTGATADSCKITVNFNYENIVLSEHNKVLDVTLTATGSKSNPKYTWEGNSVDLDAMLHSMNPMEKKVVYSALNNILLVDENGVVTVNPDSEWVNAIKTNSPYTGTTTSIIQANSEDGRVSDQCNFTINLTYVNKTTSGGSSGGGGGGGGSTGVTTSGSKTQSTVLPSYVVSGQWTQAANGKWLFTAGRTYANEWAAVSNPYADASIGQSDFDWFRFDEDGFMVTGWYIDQAGDTYFLHDVSDNTLGRMYTGWHWIKGADGQERCYYFNPNSDGFRGRVLKNTTTPDGYAVDANGAWTINGVAVVR